MTRPALAGARAAALAAVLAVSTLAIGAQTAADRRSARSYAEATALLERMVAEQKIAGAVAAVARGEKIEYSKAVGVQDLASRAPMTDRSLFRIYSMTKAVTAVGAMMLFEEGRFRLHDPVSKYIPQFAKVTVFANPGADAQAPADGTTRPPARAITVADLLLHTSGLSHRTSDLYRREQVRSRAIALPKFIENIVRVPLMEDPGTRYRYSEGTTVVGRLIEIWSGKPLDLFFDERIFKPLRMHDTTFWVGPEQRARLATVYAPAPGGGLTPVEIEEVPFTERSALLEGAVGLVSTAPDFLRFSQMLLNGGELDGFRLLKAATVEQITSNGLPEAVQKARGGPMGWGLANVNVLIDPNAPNRGDTAGTGPPGRSSGSIRAGS